MSPTPTVGGDVAELRADVDALAGVTWGGITGTLSNQTDLQTVLNSKSEFSGSYVDLTNKPTLGDAAAKNTGTIAGTVAAGDHTHAGGSAAWGGITGTLSAQTDLQTALDGKQATGSYEPANANIQAHIGSVSNPHSVTKAQVGLANVDNTSDAAKPVSTATQTALDAKEPANANIQAHVISAHAPSNAQKNSDILKAEIEAKLTGEISSHTHAGGGAPLDAWPVGSVFIAVVSTSPATLLGGGTWAAFGAGRVLVGLDAVDPDFDVAEETGGVKTVTLTGDQSGLPQHTHIQNPHSHVEQNNSATTGSLAGWGARDTSTNTAVATGYSTQAATATNQNAGPANAAQAHTNVQPYIVVYMWKRTA